MNHFEAVLPLHPQPRGVKRAGRPEPPAGTAAALGGKGRAEDGEVGRLSAKASAPRGAKRKVG